VAKKKEEEASSIQKQLDEEAKIWAQKNAKLQQQLRAA